MFHVFHVIKIYSVLLLFFFLWHFKWSLSFQWISNLFADKNRIWRKVVISSSFIQKYFAQRDLHASERKCRKIYHVKATYFSNWVNIFGNRQGELWQLILDEHIGSSCHSSYISDLSNYFRFKRVTTYVLLSLN